MRKSGANQGDTGTRVIILKEALSSSAGEIGIELRLRNKEKPNGSE
jgi:hypothetical protein